MYGDIEGIKNISVTFRSLWPESNSTYINADENELLNEITMDIEKIAGKNCIKHVDPIKKAGPYKVQSICFIMDNTPYIAIVKYNNALTEGWVDNIEKAPRKS